jgi:hypothetical protein
MQGINTGSSEFTVMHIRYGQGIVTSFNDSHITIQFNDSNKKFPFPGAFEAGFLQTENLELNIKIQSAISGKKEMKQQEKEKKEDFIGFQHAFSDNVIDYNDNPQQIYLIKPFKEIKGGTEWELDEFINILEDYFGVSSEVHMIMKTIIDGLCQVKGKVKVKKRKGIDVTIKLKENGNVATFWLNSNSVKIRVVGDEVFDNPTTIYSISELKQYNVIEIMLRMAMYAR